MTTKTPMFPLNLAGKVNKSEVLLTIMKEEAQAGRGLNIDRIVEIARDRISLAPDGLQPEKEVNRDDYRGTLPRFRISQRESSSNGQAPAPPTIKPLPLTRGKVSKVELLAEIIREEREAGRALDKKKIFLIAQKRVEQVPHDQRPEKPFRRNDYANALRKVSGLPPYPYKRKPTKKVVPPTTPVPEVLPPVEKITLEDLQAAKLYISSCGGSLTRAEKVLSALHDLMKE